MPEPITPPQPMVPHVCMVCGDARGVAAGWGVPYCMNHGPMGLLMSPVPLDRLRGLAAAPRKERG